VSLLGWAKPEYLFQPRRLLRRLAARGLDTQSADVCLPWGLPIRVPSRNALGRALRRFGVYDLAVSETLWRLTDPGETVADVGANVGYTAAVAAGRLGGTGTVLCFEAHPKVFEELRDNLTRWRRLLPGLCLECSHVALSEMTGTLTLAEPPGFEGDWSSARVESHPSNDGQTRLEVPAATLDVSLAHVHAIHVLKVDVEGYEAKVLAGGRRFLKDHRVRDVIFEEHNKYPTLASDLLERYGYKIYRVRKGFFGPQLLPPDAVVQRSGWEPTNLLATRDEDRARTRLRAPGWSILRGAPPRVA
jgi:FkbM family methyltransferase